MARSKPSRRAGRPAGQTNYEADQVIVVPPKCRCGSTNLRVVKTVETRAIAGRLTNNERYTSITWQRKMCEDCGARQVAREYRFDPTQWIDAADHNALETEIQKLDL